MKDLAAGHCRFHSFYNLEYHIRSHILHIPDGQISLAKHHTNPSILMLLLKGENKILEISQGTTILTWPMKFASCGEAELASLIEELESIPSRAAT